jgi:hypothetical protein
MLLCVIGVLSVSEKSFASDPIGQYLREFRTTTNDKIAEIDTELGSKRIKVTMLSLISTNVAANNYWNVYYKNEGRYKELTNYIVGSTESPLYFDPKYSTLDEHSHSIIHYYNGGGGFGSILAITIVKGHLKDLCLCDVGPGTDDPDSEAFQKYFPEGFKPVPVKIIPLPYKKISSPPSAAAPSVSPPPSPNPSPSP